MFQLSHRTAIFKKYIEIVNFELLQKIKNMTSLLFVNLSDE